MNSKSEITQEEIIAWGGPEVFNQALAIVNSGDVLKVEYDDERREISGRIDQPSGWEMPLKFRLEANGRIHSECPCERNQRYGMVCEHVVALGIALMVSEMEDVQPATPDSKHPSPEAEPEPEPEESFIEVPITPKFYAFVCGSRASLSIEIDAWYGDIDFPACSVQGSRTVWMEDPDDPLVRRTRSMEAEKENVRLVERYGFERGYRDGDLRFYLTDPQKVLNFLGGGLPFLRRRGWRVDLEERLMKLTDTMPTVVPVVTIKDAPGGAFDVRYDFDAMGTDVSPVEIQAAINRGDGYILKDGNVTLLDISAIETMHDVFRDCARTQGGAESGWFRVNGIHAPYVRASLEVLDSVDLVDDEAIEWRKNAADRSGGTDAKYEPIALGKLEGILRPYQKQGVYWMRFLENAGLSGLLADEMGLGKTLQTLTWLSLPRSGEDANPADASRHPALIVCPTSLVRNWESETKKFTPWVKTLVLSGADRRLGFAAIDSVDLVITSYALLQRDFDEAYQGRRFSAVVLDEAQHIKNRHTRNARAAKNLLAERRLVLTGTPVENSVADVWSIFDFLMPEYLGDYETFKREYELPINEGGENAVAVQAKLKRKLDPFIMRRLKKSVAKDLPDKLVKVSYCPIPDDVRSEYQAVLQKERCGAKTKFEMLALLMKLRQIASRGKVDAFMELLDEAIDGGHRVLVFSQFVKQLAALREELDRAGIRYSYLDGSTKDRLGECNRFNRDRSINVFLISLMAGGTGLNLTGADMVIHYDPWWNPAVEDQATDRAHRIGQTKKVYVVKMIASDTVEEKVLTLQRRKQAVIAATVSTTDAAIVERLTADDLAELLA